MPAAYKISELAPAQPLAGSELIEVVQGGQSRRATVDGVAAAHGVLLYETRSRAASTQIPAAVDIIQTLGFETAGDGGGGYYKRLPEGAAVPPGGFTDAAGGIWSVSGRVFNVRQFGATGTSPAADAAARDLAEAAAVAAGGGVIYFPPGIVAPTYGAPPAGVRWVFDGPEIDRASVGGTAGLKSQTYTFGYLGGPHPDHQKTVGAIRALAKGSGAIGAQWADYALHLEVHKEFWSRTQGTPQPGEIDGLTIIYRQGGPTQAEDATYGGISSGAGILVNTGATEGAGMTQTLEAVNSVFDHNSGLSITYQTGVQILPINRRENYSYGAVFNSMSGHHNAAIRTAGSLSSRWTRIIENQYGSIVTFAIDDQGETRWQSPDGAFIGYFGMSANGDVLYKDEFGSIFWQAKRNNVKTITSFPYNIEAADRGMVLILAASAPGDVNLPNSLPVGFSVTCIQRDAQQIAFVAASGGQLRNVDNHTKTGGQYAQIELVVGGKSSGNNIWYLSGRTGT